VYQRLDSCPLCEHNKISNFLIVKDYFLSKEDFHLSKCDNCTLVFTNPRPSLDKLSIYYDSNDYLSHKDQLSPVGIIYQLLRQYNINYKKKLINQFVQPQSILDYGCGTGQFLSSYAKDLFRVGVEPDDSARSLAIHKHDLSVYPSLGNIEKGMRFDLISLWHVLEHIYELNNTFSQLRKLLSKEGMMTIAVPNIDSLDCNLYQKYWAAYDVPRHLYHFGETSIKELFRQHRMKIIGKSKLWLDAYYISLQSSKYRGDKLPLLMAIKNGFASNRLADSNGAYSSNVYFVKKY
jgi:SAM-dependent methyltransferase